MGYGHLVFSVNPETKTSKSVNFASITIETFQIKFSRRLKLIVDNIVLDGTFYSSLAFDFVKTPVG